MNEEERRTVLDGIFYDNDGSFIPLTDSHGNVNGNVASLRDTYMTSEKEYFEYLLSNIKTLTKFKRFLQYNSDELASFAIEIQYKLETGTLESPEELKMMETMTPEQRDYFHMGKLEEAEGLLCLLLAAIRDKVKILELVHVKEEELGRSK